MIAHHDELSLPDMAEQASGRGAWRRELQLALSASVSSCGMNKLASCHNIIESGEIWIQEAFPLLCLASAAQRKLFLIAAVASLTTEHLRPLNSNIGCHRGKIK